MLERSRRIPCLVREYSHLTVVIYEAYLCDGEIEEDIQRTIGCDRTSRNTTYVNIFNILTFRRDFLPVVTGQAEDIRKYLPRSQAAL